MDADKKIAEQIDPTQTAIVCIFADALREIRKNEIELLRLSTVDCIRSMCDAMRELRADVGARG